MPKGWGWYKPKMPYFHSGKTFLDGNNDYTKGFNDGCQTILTLTGGAFVAMPTAIDGWKLTNKNPNGKGGPHPEIKNKEEYLNGFNDATETCFYYYDWDAL
jgi:hypothetical protein